MTSGASVGPSSVLNRLTHSGQSPEVLLLSMRRIARLVAYCIVYEFEDVISEVTAVDRVEADCMTRLERSRRAYKYLRLTMKSTALARTLAPAPSRVALDRDYELFFPVFNNAYELFSLATVPDWRRRSRLAACYIGEIISVEQLPDYLLEMLQQFDHIFVADNHAVAAVQRITGRPCTYLPLAADVVKFSPYPLRPERCIDVINIGRRSPDTHEALLAAARQRKFFYHYDTVEASGVDLKQRTFRVQNSTEHRFLLANLLKRSRYCFAYRGFVNDPEITAQREDMSARFYEGAAAGSVMLGQPANIPEFRDQFDWPDVIVDLPYGSREVMAVIDELDRDPERIARIRRANVSNAARRHDWLHRWFKVYETLQLQPTARMLERREYLERMAVEASQL